MAAKHRSDAEAERQALDAARRAQRERYEEDRARRELAAQALGERVQEAVRLRLSAHAEEMDTPLRTQPNPKWPSRSLHWKGPHFGKSYRDAASLERATREECAAGFAATWGYEMTDQDRHIFRIVVTPDQTFAMEQRARDVYKDLRKAIDAANHYAKTHYNQSPGCAAVALAHLWGRLPALPVVNKLPGYEKVRPLRRALIETWQSMAKGMLGRLLSPRELAELSILLGVGPGQSYAMCFATKDGRKLGVSPADVLGAEAKRLEKFAAPVSPP